AARPGNGAGEGCRAQHVVAVCARTCRQAARVLQGERRGGEGDRLARADRSDEAGDPADPAAVTSQTTRNIVVYGRWIHPCTPPWPVVLLQSPFGIVAIISFMFVASRTPECTGNVRPAAVAVVARTKKFPRTSVCEMTALPLASRRRTSTDPAGCVPA